MSEWRKEFHEEEYRKGQEAIAREIAAQDLENDIMLTRQAGKLAAESFALADQLAANGDPYAGQVADFIKSNVAGALNQAKGAQQRAGREPGGAAPFSVSSQPSPMS